MLLARTVFKAYLPKRKEKKNAFFTSRRFSTFQTKMKEKQSQNCTYTKSKAEKKFACIILNCKPASKYMLPRDLYFH